ncbi:MAG: hypothetical protein ACTSRB_18260, partial [Candidatus Helarchaeota archaeon]
ARRLNLKIGGFKPTLVAFNFPNSVTKEESLDFQSQENDVDVKIKRGGEFKQGIYQFKVKVENDSSSVITDVLVQILSFPESLKLIGESTRKISKINRSLTTGIKPIRFPPNHMKYAWFVDCLKRSRYLPLNS